MRSIVVATCLWACSGTEHTALLQSQLHMAESAEYQAGKAMFPSLSSLSDPKSSRAALAQIQQTVIALNQDRSQVTPLVRTVVETVITTLNTLFADTGAIKHGHTEDVAILAADIANFASISPADSARLGEMSSASAGHVAQQVQALSTCYTTQAEVCDEVNVCTDLVTTCNSAWVNANNDFIAKDAAINTYWCEDNRVRTTAVFQDHSAVNLFVPYNTALDTLVAAASQLETTSQDCSSDQATYRERLVTCTASHENTISTACSHYGAVEQIRKQYLDAYDVDALKLNNDIASVQLREGDRKVEWEVLTRVVCLLTTLTDQTDEEPSAQTDQEPSDQTDEAPSDPQGHNAQDIAACQAMDVDVSDLTIEYPDVPDKETTAGLLPDAPAAPCTTEFTDTLTFESECDGELATSVDADGVLLYGGGQLATCFCGAASVDADSSQLPSLPHYLLVNTPMGNAFSITDNEWSATVDGTAFHGDVGQCHESPTADDADRKECHVYGSPSAAAEVAGSETLLHHFMSHGGIVYKSGETLVSQTWSPMTGTLGQAIDAIMMFGEGEVINVDPCSGTYHSCAVGFCPATTTEFCWYQEIDGACQQGCLVYRWLGGTFLQYKRLV